MALRAVPDHPKFAGLKARMGFNRIEALGTLETLWHFTGRFTPQGNVGKYPDSQIEAWMEWRGEPGTLIAGLLSEGWIDADEQYRLVVHDWSQYADELVNTELARGCKSFCDGSLPKTGRLNQVERERFMKFAATEGIQTRKAGRPLAIQPKCRHNPAETTKPEPEPEPEPVLTAAIAASVCEVPPVFESSSSTEKQNRNGSYSGRAEFEREFREIFWPLAWTKPNKPGACKAFVRARLAGATCEEICTKAKEYGPLIIARALSQGGTPTYPATWLNREGWTEPREVYLNGVSPPSRFEAAKQRQDDEFWKIMERKGVV